MLKFAGSDWKTWAVWPCSGQYCPHLQSFRAMIICIFPGVPLTWNFLTTIWVSHFAPIFQQQRVFWRKKRAVLALSTRKTYELVCVCYDATTAVTTFSHFFAHTLMLYTHVEVTDLFLHIYSRRIAHDKLPSLYLITGMTGNFFRLSSLLLSGT